MNLTSQYFILYQNVAPFKLFTLPAKYIIKPEGVWLDMSRENCKEIMLCMKWSLEADIPWKRRIPSSGRYKKNEPEVK